MDNPDLKYESNEITKQVNLCLPNGRLNPDAIGWSKKPYQISNLSGSFFRKKLWNYWCITGSDGMFSLTISDIDYAGMIFAYYLDYATGEFQELGEIIPLSKGLKMPNQPHESIEFENENLKIHFQVMGNGKDILLNLDWYKFHGKRLKANFTVSTPDSHESLNVVVPWSEKKFQYTAKQFCLPVSGEYSLSDGNVTTTKAFSVDSSFACLDYGRGVWPYKSTWNWGCFSGRVESDIIGLTIGGKWTDGTGISENGFLINGKLTKIQEPVEWNYDPKNFKSEWKMKSKVSDILEVSFQPFYERTAISNLGIIYSEVHQCFGRYSGVIRSGHKNYKFENLVGWAEEHKARW
jgi:hypothetical protein